MQHFVQETKVLPHNHQAISNRQGSFFNGLSDSLIWKSFTPFSKNSINHQCLKTTLTVYYSFMMLYKHEWNLTDQILKQSMASINLCKKIQSSVSRDVHSHLRYVSQYVSLKFVKISLPFEFIRRRKVSSY